MLRTRNGTGCIIDAAIQHPWIGMWVCFLDIKSPLWGNQHPRTRGPQPPAPQGWDCPLGLSRELGCAGAAPQWPIAEGRESGCSRGKEFRASTGWWGCACTETSVCAHTHPPQCTRMYTRVHTPACAHSSHPMVHPEHPPSCFCDCVSQREGCSRREPFSAGSGCSPRCMCQ